MMSYIFTYIWKVYLLEKEITPTKKMGIIMGFKNNSSRREFPASILVAIRYDQALRFSILDQLFKDMDMTIRFKDQFKLPVQVWL